MINEFIVRAAVVMSIERPAEPNVVNGAVTEVVHGTSPIKMPAWIMYLETLNIENGYSRESPLQSCTSVYTYMPTLLFYIAQDVPNNPRATRWLRQ